MAFAQKNRIAIARHINNRTPFTHQSMSGKWLTDSDINPYYGDLPPEYVAELRSLLSSSDVYVVFSYRTPIAYAASTPKFTIPEVKYSVTTTHHQTIVKLADHYAANY